MAATTLNQPVAGSGAPRTFFFNGRLLSAEDLTREQGLREHGDSQLGSLLGCGVASGCAVSGRRGASVVTVGGGVGVTPAGRVLAVDGLEIDLAAAGQRRQDGGFADCTAAMSAQSLVAGGLYLLVLTPAWLASGRAPTLLGEVGACNRALEQPAVRPRLLPMKTPPGADGRTLRNRCAHALLAPDDPLATLWQGPAAQAPAGTSRLIGWLPATTVPALTVDDLPLAVIRLDGSATLDWCDADAAQRRLAPPPGLAGDRFWRNSHALEMEALARQFVRQAEEENDAGVQELAASFAFLPPVALVSRQLLRTLANAFVDRLSIPLEAPAVSRAEFAENLHLGLQDAPLAVGAAALRQTYRYGRNDLRLLRFTSARQMPEDL